MTLTWIREPHPVWDEDKERIIGGAPPGALAVARSDAGLAGDWFAAVETGGADGGRVVGCGWIDSTWGGDTEILLAVDPARQSEGIGGFVLRNLEQEAAARGSNYVYNTVRETHPRRDEVRDWLLVRGYEGDERDATLRKRVGPVAAAPAAAAPGRRVVPVSPVPPGSEEAGGYVDVELHRY